MPPQAVTGAGAGRVGAPATRPIRTTARNHTVVRRRAPDREVARGVCSGPALRVDPTWQAA